MREPGADCPECSEPIFRGKCTACGWTASAQKVPKVPKLCFVCGEDHQLWTSLTQGEDGERRCATCHVAYLTRRVVLGARCTEVDEHGNLCGKSADEHREEFKRLVGTIGKEQDSWRTTPSLLERMGHHALRPSVKKALGLAETAPDPTPSEWAEHERRKAEAARLLRAMNPESERSA